MNNRHLPAGQGMQGAGGPAGVSGGEMPTGPSQGGGGGGRGGRGQRHYSHQYHQHQHQPMHHYANYVPPYPAQYYPPVHPHPQYQNGGMQSPAYMPYQMPYGRSPPPMQPYVPMVGVSVQQNYPSRPSQQQSPVLSNPYQPPPVPVSAPIPPQTPSSTHSSYPPPAPATPPVVPVEAPKSQAAPSRVETPPAAPARPAFRAPVSLLPPLAFRCYSDG